MASRVGFDPWAVVWRPLSSLTQCRINNIANVARAVSAALHAPIGGGEHCHKGPNIPVPSPLSTPEKASISLIEILSARNQ